MRERSPCEPAGGCRGEFQTPIDTVFRVLADRNRRAILRYLHTRSTDMTSIDDLAHHLATVNDSFRDHHQSKALLHHAVLPTLEEAGAVEYDGRSETVRYREDPVLNEVLDRIDELDLD